MEELRKGFAWEDSIKLDELNRTMDKGKVEHNIPIRGSCHHGMTRPLGFGWGRRPPDMEVSYDYIE